MTGGAGSNRARLQPKSFDTEGRPPATSPTATTRPAGLLMSSLRVRQPRAARPQWRPSATAIGCAPASPWRSSGPRWR